MNTIFGMPAFGVFISLAAFEAGLLISKRSRHAFVGPLLNPLLLAIVLVIWLLKAVPVSLEDYNQGGRLISFLLAPATVALAVPLYKNLELLKQNGPPIILGILFGSTVNVTLVLLLCRFFDISKELTVSMVPKSVTTPIGIALAEQLGGAPEITIPAIISTGIAGVIIGPPLLRLLRIKDPVAVGVAMGTASHALGTARAIEMGEAEGAMSALSIGVAGVITVLIAPVLLRILS